VLFSPRVSRRAAVSIALAIGIAAAIAAAIIPHSIRFRGVGLGDIALPAIGMQAFQEGGSPYALRLRSAPAALYPFTTMILLWPLTLLPRMLIVPTFIGLSSAALAYGLAREGPSWRLLLFLSPPYWAAIESVQWSPLVTASLFLPALLPIAVLAKPQLALVPIVSGRWSLRTIAATIAIALISIIIWPAWPIEWLRKGNLQTFVGFSPLLTIPGFLLLAAAIAWRTRAARLLLAMSLPLQRYFYDQLPLFLIPKNWRQMVLLLTTSWSVVGVALWCGWYAPGSGVQTQGGFIAIVIGVYLPALGMVLFEHFRGSALKERALHEPVERDSGNQ
jgi:hypothetical protein